MAAIHAPTPAPVTAPARAPKVVEAPQFHMGLFHAQHAAQSQHEVARVSTGAFGASHTGPIKHAEDAAVVGGFGSASTLAHAQENRGRVVMSGFADGREDSRGTVQGHVAQAGFDASQVAAARPVQATRQTPPTTNVVVLSDPKPSYTAEARRLKIQGDVVLRVRFTTSGQVELLGIVQGLGHGLDQMAEQAAERIRFKPATSNGRPVDEVTLVHILFQLS